MKKTLEKELKRLKEILKKIKHYEEASKIIDFDRLTSCPEKGTDESGEIAVSLEALCFRYRANESFVTALKTLYGERELLSEKDRVLIDTLYRAHLHNRNITEEQSAEFQRIKNHAYDAWSAARKENDFKLFEKDLDRVVAAEKERVSAWDTMEDEKELSLYGRMLYENEFGITEDILNPLFESIRDKIISLLSEREESNKNIRTDFLGRTVTAEQQELLSEYLLTVMGFDKERGALALSEHPFTDILSPNDVRITTYYENNNFLANFYTILHEGGHALFEQNQPADSHEYFIENNKTMGMHESVSRFYENVLGRSKEFIHFIYPKLTEIFPQVLYDVTEQEFYEAVNRVEPSLIRMDADEVTYCLHIIIRYEIEKELVAGSITAKDVPGIWNEKYRDYLGIEPDNDREGALQDSHWTDGFGYFPTYLLGNIYNAMYLNTMMEEFDPFESLGKGDFSKINRWMEEHVFKKADILNVRDWIRDITGRELTAEDFIFYLDGKFHDIYIPPTEENKSNKHFIDYVKHMTRIRLLSSPVLDKISSADAYRAVLSDNFKKIGEMAEKNRDVVSKYINPILESEEELSETTINQIRYFNENLMDIWTHNNIDLPVMTMLSDRLMKDAEKKDDVKYLIRQLDEQLTACITLVEQTRRILTGEGIIREVREKGLEALKKLLAFLDKDSFRELDEESREIVMINSRYGDGLFVTMSPLSDEERKFRIDLLTRSLEMAEDPFYREMLPEYDWEYHVYRTYQYFSSFDEFDNAAGFNEEELKLIAYYGKKEEELWNSDEEKYREIDTYGYNHAHTMRNCMHAGEISKEKYREELLELYDHRKIKNYEIDSIVDNIEIPREYASTLDKDDMNEKQMAILEEMYINIVNYVFRMPKLGEFYVLLDYYAPMIFNFIEVPGGMTFEEMGLKSFAAFHPPTYIHSMMVAKVSRCLAGHLLKEKPELFYGICGFEEGKSLKDYRDSIISFVYHSALCHDFGKLIIIDTIFIYGRKILDFEFDIIKQHTPLGYMLLSKYESTKDYAEVALGHHLWYDGSRGYPLDFDVSGSKLKTIIDIVTCADCMDAATDSVGRSYNKGKNLDSYIEEVKKDAGTRYAPYLPELLEDPDVKRDLEYILDTGRQNAYRDTWVLLRGVQDEIKR